MKALVIGSGGREHALAWKLAQSPTIEKVWVAPGNGGTSNEPKVANLAIDPLNFAALVAFVNENNIDFTVIGPEAPLVAGIVDYFEAHNCRCLGPSKACAQLEGSKSFAKQFMQEHKIPTANAMVFTRIDNALAYLQDCQFPTVIKADGLAGGKGVIIAHSLNEASQAVNTLLIENTNSIVIEDFIQGEEVSFIVLSDGKNYIPFATSQDHKTRDDGDKGPNTGGMGAYSPAPRVTPELHQQILKQVIEPTLMGMTKAGTPFKGFLYAGLMITPNNEIKVLEYNCRFGDPETQPILMRLQSDFAQMCYMALDGKLNSYAIQWDSRPAIGVVLAAKGYPDQYRKGDIIPDHADPSNTHCKVFHAGTIRENDHLRTNGGRVLCVTCTGNTLQEAQTKTYDIIKTIAWDGIFYRTDIGHRAVNL